MEHALFDTLALNRECVICCETKTLKEFSTRPVSYACTHTISACLECVQLSLQAQLEEKSIQQIICPECPELLTFRDVQAFVTPVSFRTHTERDMYKTISSISHFVWCPLSGCESGQIHWSGIRQPLVLCQGCRRQFCFTHQTAWHREHTCDEWDQYLADDTFRSQLQREREREEAYDAEIASLDLRIKEAKHQFQQSILSAEDAAKARFEFAEARRREEERAAAERARVEEQRRLAREEEQRKLARRREMEEGEKTVSKLSRPCPGCKRPTEKIDGCNHIRCTQCLCHWDWVVGREYPPGQLWF
ncbi:uncharacterized protein PG986_001201 [Apiospora aurea]|uniref:RBR-type E3 ubiquitin transferase n=1 Tax=Apiospora aurea TaxID=335848 RepID=A0ABR1QW83_9PEZI